MLTAGEIERIVPLALLKATAEESSTVAYQIPEKRRTAEWEQEQISNTWVSSVDKWAGDQYATILTKHWRRKNLRVYHEESSKHLKRIELGGLLCLVDPIEG